MSKVRAGDAFAVYGLLRAGESGFARFGLEQAFAPLGPCLLTGKLYDLGAYPGLVEGEDGEGHNLIWSRRNGD